jgi:nitrogen-specific signal transduction histidine kinase
MGMIVWAVIFAFVIFFAFLVTRMASQNKEDGLQDTGLAILEFGRAFPTEAIRQLHRTANGEALFVRLHDNKAGFMRSLRNHYACHLIEPGRVRARDSGTGRGLTVDFLDAPHHNGTFEFASAADAAEVSLWLLGNYVAADDREPPAKDHPAANG